MSLSYISGIISSNNKLNEYKSGEKTVKNSLINEVIDDRYSV